MPLSDALGEIYLANDERVRNLIKSVYLFYFQAEMPIIAEHKLEIVSGRQRSAIGGVRVGEEPWSAADREILHRLAVEQNPFDECELPYWARPAELSRLTLESFQRGIQDPFIAFDQAVQRFVDDERVLESLSNRTSDNDFRSLLVQRAEFSLANARNAVPDNRKIPVHLRKVAAALDDAMVIPEQRNQMVALVEAYQRAKITSRLNPLVHSSCPSRVWWSSVWGRVVDLRNELKVSDIPNERGAQGIQRLADGYHRREIDKAIFGRVLDQSLGLSL